MHYGLTLDLVNPAFLREKAGLFCNKAALLDDKEGLRLIVYFGIFLVKRNLGGAKPPRGLPTWLRCLSSYSGCR